MTRRASVSLFLALITLWHTGSHNSPAARADEPVKATAIGDRLPNSNSLRDLRGNRRSLHGFTGNQAVVVAFLGVECPVANLYVPSLLELEKRYRPRHVQFLAVYPNENEDLEQLASHAADRDLPFPVLKDCGQRLATLAGVTRVPTVLVLDGDFVLRYRGRVDDRFGVAARRPKATRDDLILAIEDVLGGSRVAVAETETDGCLLDRSRPASVKPEVTFARHVAPILQQRCQSCHRAGQSAPFALQTYDDAAKHGAMIREVTAQRRMPPWHADPRFGRFGNERRLTKDEINTLTAWVDGGMPRGDDRDLPKAIDWPSGWVHGKPDLVFTMPEEFAVPADGVLPYKNWIIETNFKEDRWVRVAEGRPGAPSVVHHIVVYILKEGQRGPVGADGGLSILVGWAPGDLGLVCPPDTALRVPKGARLRFEMHYTPNGKAVKDRSSVGITFADKPPKFEMLLNEFANMGFEVPPNHPHHPAEATMRFRADARILSVTPHMHWRGKDYRYEVIYPDGKRETLLSVPRWDFNWQNVYRFKEPLKVPKGAKLHAVAHWDNSANNPLNPDPKQSVRFGLQSWEEMMVGFVAYVWERPETAVELAKNPPSQADQLFDRLDANGDEVITPDEIPQQMKLFLLASGTKLPDKMTREEFTKFFSEMRSRFRKPPPKPDAGKAEEKRSEAK
jgi:thiol-disulfide isomerase/thioredoxin